MIEYCPPAHPADFVPSLVDQLGQAWDAWQPFANTGGEGNAPVASSGPNDESPGVFSTVGQAWDNWKPFDSAPVPEGQEEAAPAPEEPGFFSSSISELGQAYDNFHFFDNAEQAPATEGGAPAGPGVIDTVVQAVKETVEKVLAPAPQVPVPSGEEGASLPAVKGSSVTDVLSDFVDGVRHGIQKIIADDLSTLENQGVDLDTLLATSNANPTDGQVVL